MIEPNSGVLIPDVPATLHEKFLAFIKKYKIQTIQLKMWDHNNRLQIEFNHKIVFVDSEWIQFNPTGWEYKHRWYDGTSNEFKTRQNVVNARAAAEFVDFFSCTKTEKRIC